MCVCVCVYGCVFVCVCVCEREREKQRARKKDGYYGKMEKEIKSVCVCMRDNVCVCV